MVSLASFAPLEAGQRLDAQREAGEPLGERLVVLLGEQRGGNQHCDLLAVLDRLERGPDRDLGLAVADVAGDQPVHGDLAFHVGLDLVDGGELVRRLHIREGFLKLPLPRRVRGEGVAARGHPGRVQPDELARDFLDGLAGLGLGARPVRPAHLAQRRRIAADVAGHLVQLVGRHEKPVAGGTALGRRVLEHEVLAKTGVSPSTAISRHLALDQLHELPDPVLFVDHEVTGVQLERVDGVAPFGGHAPHVLRGPGRGAAQQVRFREQPQFEAVQDKTASDGGRGHLDDAGLRIVGEGVDPGARDIASWNNSARRWAGPGPSVATTMRHWSRTWEPMNSSISATSPW